MNLSKFSERLSELTFDANLNGFTLSERIGCQNSTIYRYLNGEGAPTLEILVTLADFFRCSADFLLGLEDENYTTHFNACPPFKERFPMLLKECEISQYQLEKLTKISHSAMVYWKNGRKQPTVESIVRIARALKKTVDFVLGRTNL